jgi:hypothetical protein
MLHARPSSRKGQSSLELLITITFGLIILLPITVLAFVQLSTSNSSLAAAQAQAVTTKLATVAAFVGSQGPPSKQLVLVQVPPDVQDAYVGNLTNGVGHQIIFVINTNAGLSYISAYTPVNVSGYIEGIVQPGTYMLNVSMQAQCPTPGPAGAVVSCVYITQST